VRNDYCACKAAQDEAGSPKPELVCVFKGQGYGIEKIPGPDGHGPPGIVDHKKHEQGGYQDGVRAHRFHRAVGLATEQREPAQNFGNEASRTAPSAERAAKDQAGNKQADPHRQPEIPAGTLKHRAVTAAHVRDGKRAPEDPIERELTQQYQKPELGDPPFPVHA